MKMLEAKRKYYQSSSFKMAVLFSILLGLCVGILGYFIYSYSKGQYIDAGHVAISAGAYKLILWLGVVSIILMAIVVFVSFFLSTFVVKRINIIATTAKQIMETGDLSRRIDIDKRWDDLSNLAYILNDMFARIEQLMQGVRQVSDNIAHDLRTPLTRMRNQLEQLTDNPDPTKINKLVSEADSLLDTFNALLRITNIESGKRHSQFAMIDLENLMKDVIELYEPIAEDKGIKLISNFTKIQYQGDKDLLFQAITNLLDNAIKFSLAGEVIISLTQHNKKPLIEIKDSGPGINKDEKAKVFERFYRGDSSRNSAGNGLGLSMVAAIVGLHNGKIKLLDNEPIGLIIQIQL